MTKKATLPQSLLSVQTITLGAIAWSVIALLFFLLFSVSAPGQGRPEWYGIVTYILEEVAFFSAGLLCLRNWRSAQIVSGGSVWLAIGLGMFSYFVANLLLAYWELGLGNSPAVSPGDFFFILTYIFLGWGMVRAVLSKQLNLTPVQWSILVGIAFAGIAIATAFIPSSAAQAAIPAPVAQAAPPSVATPLPKTAPSLPPGKPPAPQPTAIATPSVAPSPTAPPPVSPPTPAAIQASPSPSPVPSPDEEAHSPNTPGWAIALEEQLAPLAIVVTWLYILGDIMLVVMATTLLLAFWGGRFALSWRCIAAASFSYYVADIWFNYATNYIPNYETGALPEVFFIFSGCLFGIGAALEYDLSTRRRSARRRN